MNNNSTHGGRSDFNEAALLKEKTNRHDRDISDIKRRLVALEKRIGSNESFAKTFADAVESQNVASTALATAFNALIQTNSDTRDNLQKFVRSDHVHNILSFLKSFGGALFWVVVGALVAYLIPKFFGGN